MFDSQLELVLVYETKKKKRVVKSLRLNVPGCFYLQFN